MEWYLKHRPQLASSDFRLAGFRRRANASLLSLLRGHRMKALLRRMLDETQFLSDHGVRSLSKVHETASVSFRDRRPDLRSRLLAGGIPQAACSAAIPTGAARSGCRSIF